MNLTLYVLGREIFSFALELPAAAVISDLSSVFVPEAPEPEVEYEDEDEEEEALTRRVRGQKVGF